MPVVAACVLLGLALRAPFVPGDLDSDESGLLLVVRHWAPSAGELYGDYWVDRPPLLLAYFRLADLLPGEIGVRLLGCLVDVLLVTAAVLTGRMLGGRPGAWCAGLVAAALGSSHALGGHMTNGMLQGMTLVMGSCCALVAATRGEPGEARLYGLSAVAGALGASAALVKQNLVDGLAFAVVVLMVSSVSRTMTTRRAGTALVACLGGAAATVVAVAVWATVAGVDLSELWHALYEFRVQAAETIASGSLAAPMDRLGGLVRTFVLSGLVLVVPAFLAAAVPLVRDPGSRRYVAGAAALLAVAVVGITGGGSWWSHYLLQLLPSATVMAALAASGRQWRGVLMRVTAAVLVVAAVVATISGVHAGREPREPVAVGRYLGAAAEPGDTAFVAYGNAEVLLYAGLSSPYPHLWSLPMRVLDPQLEGLLDLLRGPRPPTWFVQLGTLNAWDIDPDGELATTVEQRYRQVATPCGYRLHLLRGESRPLPAAQPCD